MIFRMNPMIAHSRGFGLVEILIGMAVALVSMVVIMQVYSTFEGQKRTTTSGDDAQTNGILALYAIERETRAAGSGMTEGVPQQYPPVAGCTTHLYDNSGAYLIPNAIPPFASTVAAAGTVSSVRLAPAIASDGGGGLSDALTISYGTATITAPYTLRSGYTPGAATLDLAGTSGIAMNGQKDMIVLIERNWVSSPPGIGSNYITPTTCSLLQVTGAPAAGIVPLAMGTTYNRATGTGLPAFSDNAQVYNLGQLNLVTYRVAGSNLVADISRFGVTPNGGAGTAVANRTDFSPMASNIVNMQVQYGIDTGNPMGATQLNCKTNSPGVSLTAADPDAVVDSWVDPTGVWQNDPVAGTPSLFNLRRIRAVRVALVARSAIKATGRAGDLCDADPIVISWNGGPNMTPDLAATDPDWRCYRYKVFQTTIPVRNALWSSTMNPASPATCGLRDPA